MQRWTLGLAWLCVGAAVSGFFLPWFSLSPQMVLALERLGAEPGRVTIELPASRLAVDLTSLAQTPHVLTGAQIPAFARSSQGRLVAAVAELLTRRPGATKPLIAVYVVPVVALFCGLLLWLGNPRRPFIAWIVAAGCAAILAYGGWRLSRIPNEVEIGVGLWVCLVGYMGLALAAGLHAVSVGRTSR